MSFVARTHPQQGYNEAVDDRATTWEDFNPLHERFRFTVDAAASAHNTKLPRYWTRTDDGLAQSWGGGAGVVQPAVLRHPTVGRESMDRVARRG